MIQLKRLDLMTPLLEAVLSKVTKKERQPAAELEIERVA